MAVEWCFVGCKRGCSAGVKSSALQGMILLLFNHSFVGEKWGVPPWGLTNLIWCDISEVAKHHILGRNYSNYDNFFPIKAHRCSGRHGGYSSGRHGSLPLHVAPRLFKSPSFFGQTRGLFFGQTRESAPTRASKAIQCPLPWGGKGWASSSVRASWGASATCCSRRCGGCCLRAGAAGRCRRAGG